MNPILVAGPAVEPVSLEETRAFLRLDDTVEDGLITALITAARHYVEAACGRALIAQTWCIALDRWPVDAVIALPLSPLIAVESTRVFDAAGLPAALMQYQVDSASDPPRVIVDAAAAGPGRPLHGHRAGCPGRLRRHH